GERDRSRGGAAGSWELHSAEDRTYSHRRGLVELRISPHGRGHATGTGARQYSETYRRCASARSFTSRIVSAPNFSRTASASTRAVIANATIEDAGTAVVSLRSREAQAASLLTTSRDRSGDIGVALGLTAPRTPATPAFVMPPSGAPALFVSRKKRLAAPCRKVAS